MAKLAVKAGSTSFSAYIFVQDSSLSTGVGLTGLAYNTAGLVAYYVRPLSTASGITLATLAAVTSSWASGGFKEVDATNLPGVYRVDLPDAILAAGVGSVVVMLRGATNMTPVLLEIQLDTADLNTVNTNVVAVPTATQNADALLKRDLSAVVGAATRSPLSALRRLRNRNRISGGVLSVYQEDDATVDWTANVTTSAGNPISEVDPV